MEIARRGLDAGIAPEAQIGDEDVARLSARHLAGIRAAAMGHLIAAPMGQRKLLFAIADAAQQLR